MFLQKIIALNLMFIYKIKKLITRTINVNFYNICHILVDNFADMRYFVKHFIKNNVIYNKPWNYLDIKDLKDWNTFEATTIAYLVIINCYKKRTWGNKNFAIKKIDTKNIYDNDSRKLNILGGGYIFLKF